VLVAVSAPAVGLVMTKNPWQADGHMSGPPPSFRAAPAASVITKWSRCAAGSLRPLEPPEAYKQVPRRLPGCGGRNHPG